MTRSWDSLCDRADRLGRSLADLVGRHLIAAERRVCGRVRGVAQVCSALPIEATASSHALAAAAIAASTALLPVPAGPFGAALLERVSGRATRALAIRRARRTRARFVAHAGELQLRLQWIPANDVRRGIVPLAFDAGLARALVRQTTALTLDAIPIAGAALRLARATDAAIDAWATVIAADLRARRELAGDDSRDALALPAPTEPAWKLRVLPDDLALSA